MCVPTEFALRHCLCLAVPPGQGFNELEALLCNTYKRCCWEDTAAVVRVANVTTCTTCAHRHCISLALSLSFFAETVPAKSLWRCSSHDAGKLSAMREAADTFQDPSSPGFCKLVSGLNQGTAPGTQSQHTSSCRTPGLVS